MRGTRDGRLRHAGGAGIIPAYAGNTENQALNTRISRDHPRVCGEHVYAHGLTIKLPGSSPRMRGTQYSQGAGRLDPGIIPAYAGNTAS